MKRLGLALCLLLAAGTLLLPGRAFAAAFSPSSPIVSSPFDANRIIDDPIFDNGTSMSAKQINDGLNSFPSSCISPANGFQAPNPVGYTPSGGFVFGANVTAGTVIAHTAQVYGIDPRALLATLQKEQGLVSGGAGCSVLRYTGAMGYGCPDGGTTYDYSGVNLYSINGVAVTHVEGTCVNSASKAGFSQQVIRGAWLLKFGEQRSKGNINWAVVMHSFVWNGYDNDAYPGATNPENWDNSDDPQSCYGGPMTQGNYQVCPSGPTTFYDGYRTIDGQAVHMNSGATAALYWYTPHLHGNQMFDDIFTAWFGSTIASVLIKGSGSTVYLRGADPDVAYGIPSGEVLKAYKLQGRDVTGVSDSYIASLDTSGMLTTLFMKPNDNAIYLADAGNAYGIPSGAVCTKWALPCSSANLVSLLLPEVANQMVYGPILGDLARTNGTTFLMNAGVKHPFLTDSDIAASPYAGVQANTVIQPPNTGQTAGTPALYANHFFRINSSGAILYHSNGSFFSFNSFDNFKHWWDGSLVLGDQFSSFNSSPPSAAAMTDLAQDGSSVYAVNGGAKLLLPSPSNPGTPINTGSQPNMASLLNAKTTITIDSTKAMGLPGGMIVSLVSGTLRPIPTMTDLNLLFTPQNIVAAPPAVQSAYNVGTLLIPSGRVFKPSDSNAFYVYGNDANLWALGSLTDLSIVSKWGGSNAIIAPFSSVTYSNIKVYASLISTGGTYYAVEHDSAIRALPGAIMSAQKDNIAAPIANPVATKMVADGKAVSFIHFDNGTIFKVSANNIQPISSINTYHSLGGNADNTINLPLRALDAFNTGSPI